MRYLPSAKIWLLVLAYGLPSILCANLAGWIAQLRGKDPEPVFYMVIFISVIVLLLINNTLAIIRKVLEVVLALMGY